jgi:tryptophan synthase alpha chain
MSRTQDLFRQKTGNVLNIYYTAGYPHLNSTIEIMKSLERGGADIIELGMPYSDPLADGPVIQASNAKALANGMNIEILFEQLKDFRKEVSIPVILMGYLNPVLQFGFEKFCATAQQVGVDGLIIPDLPSYEFENSYAGILKKYALDFTFLVTPETSDERIRKLDSLSSGFLYAVSASSITGGSGSAGNLYGFLQRLKGLRLETPVLVGFGIRSRDDFQKISKVVNGAIIGTAFINAISEGGDPISAARHFVQQVKASPIS